MNKSIKIEKLIQDLLTGKKGARSRFIIQYEKMIWFIIHKFKFPPGCEHEKGDLFNEVILHLFREDFKVIRSYKKMSKFSTWLFLVIRNKILGLLEKEQKYSEKIVRPDSQNPDNEESLWNILPDNNCDRDVKTYMDNLKIIKNCISRLKAGRKAFITDLIFHRLSTEEMMEKYKLNSNNSVFSRKSKIISELKKCCASNERQRINQEPNDETP